MKKLKKIKKLMKKLKKIKKLLIAIRDDVLNTEMSLNMGQFLEESLEDIDNKVKNKKIKKELKILVTELAETEDEFYNRLKILRKRIESFI